ncbi:hypothetical protein PVAND_000124 [Polypedilum vanderplanki]|uniref:Reverse transcriptase domain-containing protein n=1 Tax=Polypedilum vanderplanki TaxID=319348 RepID=A0A9J6BJS2_POLVA|nr:hypothetical protein PVAND_000124 [Polypedilum vanderplanki]
MSRFVGNIKVFQWNANGVKEKLFEIFQHLNKYNIHVACICETNLNYQSKLKSDPNYRIHRLDRQDQSKRGGVAILVRKDVAYELLPLVSTKLIESIGVAIKLENGSKINIFSCYVPGSTTSQQINNLFIYDIRKLSNTSNKYYLVGDFYCKHRSWNCFQANRAGTLLYEESCSKELFIDHPPSHTHYPGDLSRRPSTIDLILSNASHTITKLRTAELMSDHISITFKICTNATISAANAGTRLDYANANWDKYKRIINYHLLNNFNEPQLDSAQQIDTTVKNLSELILHARNRAVPLTINKSFCLVIDENLKAKIKVKNQLRRLWMRTRLPHFKSQVNALECQIKQEINSIRNANWNHKLADIKPNNQTIWRTARYLKLGKRQLPPINNSGQLAITDIEKANMIAVQFNENFSNTLTSSINQSQIITRTINNFTTQFSTNNQTEETLLPTLDEVTQIIKRLPNKKAPGPDQIKNCLIKNLPTKGYLFITSILIACYKNCYFPDAWKTADITPIAKPNKNPSHASSYRPISLLNTLGKILEHTILSRLNKHCIEKSIIPSIQHGFRAGFSTVHQLKRVISHMKKEIEHKRSTALITLDVEKAFDRVCHKGLLFKLISGNFPPLLIKLISSFLSNRSFRVVINGKRSEPYQLLAGVPQGAVMSPTLFNVFTADFPQEDFYDTALFADDVAIFKSHRCSKPITNGISKAAKSISSYYKKWRIGLNAQKTTAMFVTRRRKKQLPSQRLRIFNANIEWTNQTKYLGLIIDKNLSFKPHIDYIIQRANNAIRLLYPMLARNSKLDIRNKIIIYKMAIRPILTYGFPAIPAIAKTHIKKLQVLQNKALKMIMNKPWYTSTTQIHQMCNIKPIDEYLKDLNIKFNNRLPSSHIS